MHTLIWRGHEQSSGWGKMCMLPKAERTNISTFKWEEAEQKLSTEASPARSEAFEFKLLTHYAASGHPGTWQYTWQICTGSPTCESMHLPAVLQMLASCITFRRIYRKELEMQVFNWSKERESGSWQRMRPRGWQIPFKHYYYDGEREGGRGALHWLSSPDSSTEFGKGSATGKGQTASCWLHSTAAWKL